MVNSCIISKNVSAVGIKYLTKISLINPWNMIFTSDASVKVVQTLYSPHRMSSNT